MYGDGFGGDFDFTVFVSNLPYSESRRAVEWLAQKKFSRAVVMVQTEFAEKLLSIGKKEMRAISVIANHAFEIRKIMSVGKKNFSPPPKVDSVVLLLEQKRVLSAKTIESVNKLFSYRRKTVGNILRKFGKTIQSDKRLEDLDEEGIIRLAKQIS
jgi:16S rRNA (adenine1518-N6/adenine1519-N6)-dimethyltransferase